MNLDSHVFKCGECKTATVHTLIKEYDCPDIPEAPGTVWHVECQRCFNQRIIYPTERLLNREDEIAECSECGHLKMKSAQCRICRLVNDQEVIKRKYWTGADTREVEI